MTQQRLAFLVRTLCLLFFAISFSNITAQVEKDTLFAAQYFRKADSLSLNGNHDKAIYFFQKALSIYEKFQKWEKIAYCYNKISEDQLVSHHHEEGFASAQKALEITSKHITEINDQEAYANDNICNYYIDKEDFKTALSYCEKGLSIRKKIFSNDHPRIAPSYASIAGIYSKTYNYKKAINYYKKALNIDLKEYGSNHIKVGSNFYNIGIIYLNTGEYNKAISYFKKDETITIKNFGSEDLYLGYNYINIGLCYMYLLDYDTSLHYFNKALQIAVEKDKFQLPLIYHNMGLVFEKKGEFDQAILHHQKSINIKVQTYGENHQMTALSYLNLGRIYTNKNSLTEAKQYIDKAIEISKNFYGENHPKLTIYYNVKGNFHNQRREFKKAISYYNKAILSNSKNHDMTSFSPSDYYDTTSLLESFQKKANTLQKEYQKSNDIQLLNESLVIYQNSNKLINQIRYSYQNYNDKLSAAKISKSLYADAIRANVLHYKKYKNASSLSKTLFYIEESRANVLQDLTNDTKAKNYSNIPLNLLDFEKELKIKKSFYNSKIFEKKSEINTDTSQISNFENSLFDLSRKQDSLTEILEKKYPKYYQLKYENEIISITDIQQKLDDKTTFLEFFTADNITYAFTITKNTINVKELTTPKLQQQIAKFRSAITSKNTREFKTTSHHLYQLLISPLKEQVIGENLIIVPDGPLWHINFDLLLIQNSSSNNPKELPYLLKEYAISYANSATLLFNTFNRNSTSKTVQGCLAFSFSDTTKTIATHTMSLATLRDSNDDLPGTRREIKAISDIIDGQYFYGSQAIESNFKKNAKKYKLLHLALHGEVDNDHPENSRLFFTKSKDTLEDNFLYSHELFALEIPAELTVLSACNTGIGKIAKGEGIMSLGNAFQYAGTKSLLLTSWEVSDQTTPEIMKHFYAHLKNGMSKSKALQQAKLAYLNSANANRTHPFYWGGFYLVGENSPIQFENHNWLYWFIGIGVLGGILLGYILLFRRKTKNSNLRS